MEEFISMTISAIVSGITIAIYEAFSNKRFKRIEAKYEMLVSANKEQYNMALQTTKDIWTEIEKAEDFVRNGISSQIRKAVKDGATKLLIDSSALKSAYDLFNQKSVLIPSALIRDTKELFEYYDEICDGYIALANNVIKGKEAMDTLNRYIPDMLGIEKYIAKKETLKIAYHERIRKLLFEDIE